ncbi:hypothetical protein BDN70DRAFT_993527 [Pholiota conissans]|uniref:Protein kinase domain-containing protein n=1 Tax=Pholiota conissans TaxID=109636 RepID=A0A9P5Z0X8_9AGAR|nr:hypothetical protein BDN70DRAFT_993527 [Pholiota conissans]
MHWQFEDTEDFMNRLLPVSDVVINGVFERMVFQGVYSDERWTSFVVQNGTQETHEKAVYNAFSTTTGLIHEIVASYKQYDDDDPEFVGTTQWENMISQEDEDAVRPYSLLILKPLLTETSDEQPKTGWTQVVAVGMKRTGSSNARDREELVGYLRKALCEQPDRRIIFGFLFGSSKMNVLLHDRSGVLVTETWIDIHQDPKALVQMIAAFTFLPAHRLGYDPTMQVFDKSTGTVTPSYKLRKAIFYKDVQWQITMNNGDKYLTVKALTRSRMGSRSTIAWAVIPFNSRKNYRDASSTTAEASAGDDNEPQVFVLKQSWIQVGTETEASFYDRASGSECNKVGAIKLSEEVLINGRKDETGRLIRAGSRELDCQPTPTPTPPPVPAKTRKRHRSPSVDFSARAEIVDRIMLRNSLANTPPPFISRVRVRTLLSTYGWPLRKFCTLGELLRTLRDAIEGHKYLYERGILHRDISPGNIIIVKRKPAPGKADDESYGGCLIDLDHAQAGSKCDPTVCIPTEKEQDAGKNILIDGETITFGIAARIRNMDVNMDVRTDEDLKKLQVQKDLVHRAGCFHLEMGEIMKYGISAVAHAVRFGHIPHNGICSAAALYWHPIEKRFSYKDQRRSRRWTWKDRVIGTPPYASAEVLSQTSERYFLRDDDMQSSHEAVHDIESLFWILVEICMTRNGASGIRPELTDPPQEQPSEASTSTLSQPQSEPGDKNEPSLSYLVICLFLSDDLDSLEVTKREFLIKPRAFQLQIVGNFHPSFEPLRTFVLEWYSLIRLAHEFHGYEYYDIHDRSIAIFNNLLKTQGSELDRIDDAGRKVLEARKADLQAFKDFGLAAATTTGSSQTDLWDQSPHTNRSAPSMPLVPPQSPTPGPSRNKKARR